jgi:hypothetical protein
MIKEENHVIIVNPMNNKVESKDKESKDEDAVVLCCFYTCCGYFLCNTILSCLQ